MENGGQPAAGGHWLAAAPPNFRDRVVEKIMKNLPQVLQGRKVDDLLLHRAASGYEYAVFNQSNNAEDYLRTISTKMLCLQQKLQPDVQAAPDHQQQAHMEHQMQPLSAVLANSSAAPMVRAASMISRTVRPAQVQNMNIKVNQAHPSNFSPAAPIVQLHPRHPVVTQTQCPTRQYSSGIYTQQPHPQQKLMRMNQQNLRVNQQQSYHTHGGQQSHVSTPTMQIGHPDGQNNQQSAGEVDWREGIFQKITSLKDAHLSELLEFERALRARVPQIQTNEQLKSLPKKEQTDQYKKAVNIMARIRCVLSFLQVQKSNMPELAKDQFDKCQTALYSLLEFYRESKARNARTDVELQSQNCHELPQIVNISGATDNSQQKHEEQPAAEAFLQPSHNVTSRSPLAQQENHSDHLAGDAENDEVCRVAEAPVAINLTLVSGNTEPSTGGTCCQQIQQEHPADEAILQLRQNVDPAGTSPAQLEAEDDLVLAEAETPVDVEAAKTSLSPAAPHSLASDMGVNLKRSFHDTTSGTMDGSSCVWFDDESSGESCYKRRKTHDGSLLDEIRAVCSMLIETDISISKDDTGGADGTVIELDYNSVSLAWDLRHVIGASEVSMKLLVPADYPWSSPVIHVSKGGPRTGLLGALDVAFRHALGLLPEPRSIEGMARAWDSVARRVVGQFAYRFGGGRFDTWYGQWESCIPV